MKAIKFPKKNIYLLIEVYKVCHSIVAGYVPISIHIVTTAYIFGTIFKKVF